MRGRTATATTPAAAPPAAPPPPSPGIAFFDFDHTLIHGDAGPLFGRHLYLHHRRSLGRLRSWARYAPFVAWMTIQAALYRVGAVRRSRIVRSAYKGLRGVPAALFRDEMDRFVDAAIPQRIYPRMVEEMRAHAAAGRRCVVVTTGIEELVGRTLRHFPPGVDLLGCKLLERDGRLTGRVRGPLYGVDKANIVTAYARASGAALADCHAYSDHWSDKHMLEVVGHPVAVNPRGRLERAALRRGWRVLRLDPPASPA